MAIEGAKKYLALDASILKAFSVPLEKYPWIGHTLREININLNQYPELMIMAASEIVNSGFAYLANRGPDLLTRELGTVAWWEMSNAKADVIITGDMRERLKKDGRLSNDFDSQRDFESPQVFLDEVDQGYSIGRYAVAYLPTNFLLAARYNPLNAMSMLLKIASYLRDSANRTPIDYQQMLMRALALQANFHRKIQLTQTDVRIPDPYRDLMRRFSDDFLREINYKGTDNYIPGYSPGLN